MVTTVEGLDGWRGRAVPPVPPAPSGPSGLGVGRAPARPAAPARVLPADAAGRRLHALDGLRFLAALGVVLYHFAGRTLEVWGADTAELFPGLSGVTVYFRVAPELFFVVSGFAILWTAWGRSVPQVVASRLARVYPTYWAALALTVLLLAVLWPEGKALSAGDVAVNATLLQSLVGVAHVDSVYWTLWAELRFYLLVVVFVAVGITRRRVLAVAALWPLAAVLATKASAGVLPELLVGRFAPFFAGGMLLFLVFRDGHAPLPWLLLAGNVGLALWTSLPVLARGVVEHTSHRPNHALLALSVVACFGVVALAALSPLRRLRWARLATLGALTYPLYLVHQLWGRWVIASLRDVFPAPLTLAVAITLAVALAVVIHAGVEQRASGPARRSLERALVRLRAAVRERVARWSSRWSAQRSAQRSARRSAPQEGRPPTGPGGSDPSRIPAQKPGLCSGSSSTVEPTPPGW